MIRVSLILVSLVILCSGCAGVGVNKKATLVPDTIGIYYETSPDVNDVYNTLKVGVRADWKLQ